ncbi:2441_t:CDS:2 [Paraglomus brasilianum]|uniref:2441_t:CDS:1 n=1 Tax=Paraglomus brasilianum TaxID=144538 RepID=A0A9N8YXJ4_9GLOM|nr:2441_t:CDS:2 [Paraglomus brasilianum]
MSGLSPSEEFSQGQQLYTSIEESTLDSVDSGYQNDVKKAIGHFTRCAHLVRELSLFSINETVDDISTTDLKYLLVEAYLGTLHIKLNEGDRLVCLEKAKLYLEQFLENVELYSLISDQDKKYLESVKAQVTGDPAKSRDEKIARAKRKKEIEKELKTLQSFLQNSLTEDREDFDRKHVLKLIELFVQKSIDELRAIMNEIEMVIIMQKMQEQQRNGQTDDRVNVHQPQRATGSNGSLLDKDGKPQRPFVLTSKREEIKNSLWRPHWSLPTMSIDEYLQLEAQRGNIISGGGKMPEEKVVDDMDEAAIDAETYKAREWDDFKDANPRGWGNRRGKG